jgi:PIN domain nuclease of toxin-antitoxin system
MIGAVADTHAAVWYLFQDARLSGTARNFMEGARREGRAIGVSVISLAEIVYLQEEGRVSPHTLAVLLDRLRDPEVILEELVFDASVVQRMPEVSRTLVPDLPDRVIAATALHFGVPVISRDRKIRASNVETIW